MTKALPVQVLPAGKVSRIHVNKHRIASNLKHGRSLPVITVKRGKENHYAHAVKVLGEITLVSAGFPGPDGKVRKQLSCGARVYMETTAALVLHTYPAGTVGASACPLSNKRKRAVEVTPIGPFSKTDYTPILRGRT